MLIASNKEKKRKRSLSGQNEDHEKVMAIKNVISATHANAGFAIYNCNVIDETRSGRRQEENYIYVCMFFIARA